MGNTVVGINNCKQLFHYGLHLRPKKSNTYSGDDVRTMCWYFWVVNTNSGEKSGLQFSIPIGSGVGEEGGVSHRLNNEVIIKTRHNVEFLFTLPTSGCRLLTVRADASYKPTRGPIWAHSKLWKRLLSPIRYLMFQIDNVNESKEFLPRIPPLSQSTQIKLTKRPAIVTASLKAIMKKLMETQTDLVILCNDAKCIRLMHTNAVSPKLWRWLTPVSFSICVRFVCKEISLVKRREVTYHLP